MTSTENYNNLNKVEPRKVLAKWTLAFALLSTLLLPQLVYAEYYKVTNIDGEVTFTDTPNYNNGNTVEKINIPSSVVSTPSTTNINASSTLTSLPNLPNTNHQQPTQYQVKIKTPEEARAYHQPAQSVSVVVDVTPALALGDTMSILIDGTPVAKGLNANIPSHLLSLGEHTLAVRLDYASGKQDILQTRNIFIIRNNRNAPISNQKMQNGGILSNSGINSNRGIRYNSVIGSSNAIGTGTGISSVKGF